nr:hypothetical protein [Tanacetum cinerariifolium]
DEIDVTNLDEAIQMSLAKARSIEEFEAQQAIKKVNEHLVDEEIEKLVEGDKESDVNKFVDDILNSQEDTGTRIELMSHKESLEKSFTLRKDMDVNSSVVYDTLKKVVPLMVDEVTNDNMMKNLPMVAKEAIKLERKNTKDDIAAMVADVIPLNWVTAK